MLIERLELTGFGASIGYALRTPRLLAVAVASVPPLRLLALTLPVALANCLRSVGRPSSCPSRRVPDGNFYFILYFGYFYTQVRAAQRGRRVRS